jgi:hypothetical protein
MSASTSAIGPREALEQLQALTAGGHPEEPGPWDDITYALGPFTLINAKNGLVRHLEGISRYILK